MPVDRNTVVPEAKPLTETCFPPSLRRFKVEDRGHSSPCFVWQGAAVSSGYGHVRTGTDSARTSLVHRAAYELVHGPIPAGMQIDHLCRVRLCMNPDHLELVTHQENSRRAKAVITHCPHGHPYSGANLIRTKAGSRKCRACDNARSHAAYLLRKAS